MGLNFGTGRSERRSDTGASAPTLPLTTPTATRTMLQAAAQDSNNGQPASCAAPSTNAGVSSPTEDNTAA
ncbi:Protein of unknown function, partial [Gryllus bimaculatus]